MIKTKLGIPVSLMAAILYLVGLFGGHLALLLLVGYVLLKEEDRWLRCAALKSLVICLGYSVVVAVLGLLPDLLLVFQSLLDILNVYFSISVINNLYNFMLNVLSLTRTIILLLLVVLALIPRANKADPLDKIAEKYV